VKTVLLSTDYQLVKFCKGSQSSTWSENF